MECVSPATITNLGWEGVEVKSGAGRGGVGGGRVTWQTCTGHGRRFVCIVHPRFAVKNRIRTAFACLLRQLSYASGSTGSGGGGGGGGGAPSAGTGAHRRPTLTLKAARRRQRRRRPLRLWRRAKDSTVEEEVACCVGVLAPGFVSRKVLLCRLQEKGG